MKHELNIKEIHNELTVMLAEIDSICKKLNLKYMLSGGSLLGAIRHEGFIPWDDDVDIMMPRDDYEKFIEKFKEIKHSEYDLLNLSQKNWDFPYARLNKRNTFASNEITSLENGLYVDIFPIDNISKKYQINVIRMWYLKCLNVLRNSARRRKFGPDEKKIFVKKIIGPMTKLIGAHNFSKLMNSCAKKANSKYEHSGYSGVILSTKYGSSEFFSEEVFNEVFNTKFESIELKVPVHFDKYLRSLYGDYEKLPDKEKRIPEHYKIYIEDGKE
ncbi:LicD family protein [Pediococcus pentosaceus]|uniref:LicD family protein n=1 Tax=Pediococcus pentosaceus TaxID=1255 RepID=UPI000E00D459|nr:LicD family protein [Pediococcus pentosaceus]KAF0519018.1 LicD family protein [Pediococcus pentosaceus]MBF7111819.1 LicD family protein [Pediococcus pentosaceus]MBF7116735.1 LicD family protein [Pediococcus pentosaceus]MBF7118475.1 LicD family protein [Pediococcus pentosaceus]MCS8577513.1 LicD family protein [Pediococcus pentosaceus]